LRPRKALIYMTRRNRLIRRLQSFQRAKPISRREARFAARGRRRAIGATVLDATNYDTGDSDFQEAIVDERLRELACMFVQSFVAAAAATLLVPA
jgi:hypothetical protein